jgi:hypothetical protein
MKHSYQLKQIDNSSLERRLKRVIREYENLALNERKWIHEFNGIIDNYMYLRIFFSSETLDIINEKFFAPMTSKKAKNKLNFDTFIKYIRHIISYIEIKSNYFMSNVYFLKKIHNIDNNLLLAHEHNIKIYKSNIKSVSEAKCKFLLNPINYHEEKKALTNIYGLLISCKNTVAGIII